MKYYIVINEWLYPTESGRDFVGTFDTLEEAVKAAKNEYDVEFQNFRDMNGVYMAACGEVANSKTMELTGFSLNSSEYEEYNMWFYSKIITVEHGQE